MSPESPFILGLLVDSSIDRMDSYLEDSFNEE